MNRMKQAIVALVILGAIIFLVAFKNFYAGMPMTFPVGKDGNMGFAVVELFTSEGCSSCPPAEELVARVQNDNPDGHIYILAYHVDYWDHQGWKDRFDNPDYSKRQEDYSAWLRNQSVYTPEIVVNGRTSLVGSDRPALLTAIADGLKEKPGVSLNITTSVAGSQMRVRYASDAPTEQSALVVALIQKSGQTVVKGGENAGLTLPHVQIVRQLLTVTLHSDSGKLSLPLPADYMLNGWEVIAFVQNNNNGTILSATRSDLALHLTN